MMHSVLDQYEAEMTLRHALRATSCTRPGPLPGMGGVVLMRDQRLGALATDGVTVTPEQLAKAVASEAPSRSIGGWLA